jgi:hypothetical protein
MLSGAYRFPAMESVVFGKAYTEALAQEVDRLDARSVFVLASGTWLARPIMSTGCDRRSATALPTFARRSARIPRAEMSLPRPTWRARPAPI